MPGHGKGPLRIAIDDWIDTGGWWDRFKQGVYDRIEGIESGIREAHPEVFATIEDSLPDDVPLARGIKRGISGEHQGGVGAIIGIVVGLGMSVVQGLVGPLARIISYAMERLVNSARLDPGTAYQAIWRGLETDKDWTDDLEDIGYTEHRMNVVEEILRPKVGVAELLTLWLRHEKSDALVDPEFSAQGWTPERIQQLKEITEIIPGVADLISMAVREAFTPETVELFRYGEDFPDPVVPWAEKLGLSREWVEKYWTAHWVLPGIVQAFNMLHRLRPDRTDVPFTENDLTIFLKTADIAPFFRERLKQIAYTPLTRVDVRRMFKTGTLDTDGVYNSYLDLGYNEQDAERMTDFTLKFETQEERDLTRGIIVSAFKRRTMGFDEALGSLVAIGYGQADADLIMAIADAELAQKKLDAELDRVEFKFVEGLIEQSQVYTELGHLNLPSEQVADLIVEWDIKRLRKISQPTKTEIFELYDRDIILVDRVDELLKRRGYDAETITWYIERQDQRMAESAAKELERAQKEQERIEKAEFATAYQRMKAGMDVEIAALKLQIADIKLAVNYMVDPEQKKLAKESILIIKRDIADWQLGKAEIKVVSIEPTPS